MGMPKGDRRQTPKDLTKVINYSTLDAHSVAFEALIVRGGNSANFEGTCTGTSLLWGSWAVSAAASVLNLLYLELIPFICFFYSAQASFSIR